MRNGSRRRLSWPAAAAAAGLVALGPITAWAQSSGPPIPAPPVEALVAEALAGAPSLAARRARLAAAAAAVPASEAPADPMLELEYRDGGFPRQTFGSDPMTMVGVTVRQPLLSAGRRRARRAVADAEVQQRHAETDTLACDLTAEIRAAYARLYALDRERVVLADATEVADLLATTAAARYAAGESDQAAVLRAQLERTRLGERLADVEGDRAMVVAALNRLVGRPQGTPMGEVTALPDPPVLPAALGGLAERAGEVAPEVALRRSEAELAGRRVDSARAELQPSFSVGGGVFWQGGADRVATVSLGIEWPARKGRRQKPMLAAARHELEAARQDQADASAEASAEAARLVVEIRRASEQIDRYRSGLLEQSSAALDATRSSYLTGRGDFAAVIDEFRRWTDLRVELARREAARYEARGRLDVLVNPAEHGNWGHDGPSATHPITEASR